MVIPVYRGEMTIEPLVRNLVALSTPHLTPGGAQYRVAEVLLVFDNGPDRSDRVIRSLAEQYDIVRPVWLLRNFGQHAATAAGIASSGSEWVVTMDEDGQHDPDQIGRLVETAVSNRTYLVYGISATGAPHPWWRNTSSRGAKAIIGALAGIAADEFSSFRLIEGTRARTACAFISP